MSSDNSQAAYNARVGVTNHVYIYICCSVGVVAVLLRLLSRYRGGLSLGLDDAFSFMAILFSILTSGTALWGYHSAGWGQDPAELSPDVLNAFLKSYIINATASTTTIFWIKLAVLYLYRRIFGVSRFVKISINVLVAYAVLFETIVIFIIIFQCSPVAAAWTPALRPTAQCLNLSLLTVIAEPLNALNEFLIWLLPIHCIRKLHLPIRQRVGLGFIFGLGILAVACSITRSVDSYWQGANSFDISVQEFWDHIQIMTGILAMSIPTFRHLLPKNLGVVSTYFRRRLNTLSSMTKNFGAGKTTTRATHARPGRTNQTPGVDDLSTFDLGPDMYHAASREIKSSGSETNGNSERNVSISSVKAERIVEKV